MDITAIGEILIDLTQQEIDEQGIPCFKAYPGGAPANLCVAAARLGAKTAFVGRVGRDSFGGLLRKTLTQNGVSDEGLTEDPLLPTTLAIVSLSPEGERSFSFYRDPSADVNLSVEDVPLPLLRGSKVVHFGSVSLTKEPSRSATLGAAAEARRAGALISYDPNYRKALWQEEEEAIREMIRPLSMTDIVKVSDEELPLLSGSWDLQEGSRRLLEMGPRLVLVTLGEKGAFYRWGSLTGHVPGVKVRVGDTNGAGDTFFGAFLSRFIERGADLARLEKSELEEMIAFANRAAALTASRRGAIPAMPTREEVETFSEDSEQA